MARSFDEIDLFDDYDVAFADVDAGDDDGIDQVWERIAALPMASPESRRIADAVRGARGHADSG